jgi:thiol-disulfide isomerase/thioredoxin
MNTLNLLMLFTLIGAPNEFAALPPLQESLWIDNYKEAHRLYLHYNKEKPVVMVFHATWCAPCKQLAIQFNKINKQQLHDKYICARLDIEDSANKSLIKYIDGIFPKLWPNGVRVPTVVVLGADRQATHVGYMDAKKIIKFLDDMEQEWYNRNHVVPEEVEEAEPVIYYNYPSYTRSYSGCPTCVR